MVRSENRRSKNIYELFRGFKKISNLQLLDKRV